MTSPAYLGPVVGQPATSGTTMQFWNNPNYNSANLYQHYAQNGQSGNYEQFYQQFQQQQGANNYGIQHNASPPERAHYYTQGTSPIRESPENKSKNSETNLTVKYSTHFYAQMSHKNQDNVESEHVFGNEIYRGLSNPVKQHKSHEQSWKLSEVRDVDVNKNSPPLLEAQRSESFLMNEKSNVNIAEAENFNVSSIKDYDGSKHGSDRNFLTQHPILQVYGGEAALKGGPSSKLRDVHTKDDFYESPTLSKLCEEKIVPGLSESFRSEISSHPVDLHRYVGSSSSQKDKSPTKDCMQPVTTAESVAPVCFYPWMKTLSGKFHVTNKFQTH